MKKEKSDKFTVYMSWVFVFIGTVVMFIGKMDVQNNNFLFGMMIFLYALHLNELSGGDTNA